MRANLVFPGLMLAILLSGSCLAQTPAITSFSGQSTFGSINGTDQTIGFTFTPTSNLIVSALGVWETDTSVPLTQTHQVGLWDSGGSLLASTTVLTNSAATGSWRYVSITPVNLTAGQTYTIGSEISSPFSDIYARVPASGGSVTTLPLITIGTSATNASAGGFGFPNTPNATFTGRFGPNLLVAQAPSPPPGVPIPPTLLLTAIGLLALGLIAMRKRASAS